MICLHMDNCSENHYPTVRGTGCDHLYFCEDVHPWDMLGTQVRVKLAKDIFVEGELLSYFTDGTCTVRDATGELVHSWPTLDIEQL